MGTSPHYRVSRVGEPGFGQQPRLALALIGGVTVALISPPLAVATIAVGLWRPAFIYRWRVLVISTLVGVFAISSGMLGRTLIAGWAEFLSISLRHDFSGLGDLVTRRVGASSGLLVAGWFLMLWATPLTARAFDVMRPRRPHSDAQYRAERAREQAQRTEGRARTKARRRITDERAPASTDALWLGEFLEGEAALPQRDGAVVLPVEALCRHLLVMGSTGSGKTETLMRIALEFARVAPRAPIFFLDGKGDRDAATRFLALMQGVGRRPRVFPQEPFCGWRGDGRAIYNRLMELIDYSEEGDGAYYRDVAKAVVRLACRHPEGPPRSTRAFLRRLDFDELVRAHGGDLGGLEKKQLGGVRLRYEAFFRQIDNAVDGLWAWEDVDSAYLLLDTQALKSEAEALARFLFEDFSHYFTQRKKQDQLAMLIVDEFSALAEQGSMAGRVEQARGFNTALVLAPQLADGMGDEKQTKRILGSVETIVLHRMNAPEDIVELAGTRESIEWSQHYRAGLGVGEGAARMQHQYRVDPNAVRSLEAGEAFAISRGRALRMLVARAPHEGRVELPQRALPRAGGVNPAEPRPAQASVRELPY